MSQEPPTLPRGSSEEEVFVDPLSASASIDVFQTTPASETPKLAQTTVPQPIQCPSDSEVTQPAVDTPKEEEPSLDDFVEGGQMEPQSLTIEETNKNILFAILKQVRPGMDLTKVKTPAFLLEPRSVLEVFADMNAYPLLFNEMGKPGLSAAERMIAVVRWYFSALSSRKSCKMPYNGLLGETFRCCWDCRAHGEGVTSYSSEQVSVNPPMSAFYVENRQCGVTFNCSLYTRSKFFQNSAGMFSDGEASIILSNYENEEYIVTFPATYARNLFLGTIRFEYAGEATIRCPRTGLTALIDFKGKGVFFGDWDWVEGKISQEGSYYPLYTLKGKWNQVMTATDCSSKKEFMVWDAACFKSFRKIVPLPEDQDEMESQRVWKKVSEFIRTRQLDRAPEERLALEDQQAKECREREELGIKWQHKMFSYDEAKKQYVYKKLNTTIHDPEKEGPLDIVAALRAHKPVSPDPNKVALDAAKATRAGIAALSLEPQSVPADAPASQ